MILVVVPIPIPIPILNRFKFVTKSSSGTDSIGGNKTPDSTNYVFKYWKLWFKFTIIDYIKFNI